MKGKVFSALGEWLWYLSGTNDYSFINYYIPGKYEKETEDGKVVRSGYGERLMGFRGINQLDSVIELLKRKNTTRRAVIQLFDASDIEKDYVSIPCTCTLQFVVRGGRLHLYVNMRSNDAYFGLPHDIFAFTMLQELIARSIGVEIGEYKHGAGSLHLYEDQVVSAQTYLGESWQATVAMPEMPSGDPWASVDKVRNVERQLREEGEADIAGCGLSEYWKDLCRLLAAYRSAREANIEKLRVLREELNSPTYKVFLEARIDKLASEKTDSIGRTGDAQ